MSDLINIFDTAAYNYELPEELIAQTPAEPRDSSRLMYYDRASGRTEHLIFKDIADILNPGDVLVINDTRVIPARFFAFNENGREFEVLLLKRIDLKRWECLLKPAKKVKIGGRLVVNSELSLVIRNINPDDGVREAEFEFDGVFEDILSRVGSVPLPPYITEKLEDPERYQTVYARESGSAAAPTAGLHFTEELLKKYIAACRSGYVQTRQDRQYSGTQNALRILPRDPGSRFQSQSRSGRKPPRNCRGHYFGQVSGSLRSIRQTA